MSWVLSTRAARAATSVDMDQLVVHRFFPEHCVPVVVGGTLASTLEHSHSHGPGLRFPVYAQTACANGGLHWLVEMFCH